MTIQNFASFEADTAQTSATSKLVKAWEAKNAKRAVKASGATLMALSLSACGGSDDVAAPVTPVTPAVDAAQSFVLTTSVDLESDFTGGSGADTFTADNTGTDTSSTADTLNGAGGRDTLNVFSDGAAGALPALTSVEIVNVYDQDADITLANAAQASVDTLGLVRGDGELAVTLSANIETVGLTDIVLSDTAGDNATTANGVNIAAAATATSLTVNASGITAAGTDADENINISGAALENVTLNASGDVTADVIDVAGASAISVNATGDVVTTIATTSTEATLTITGAGDVSIGVLDNGIDVVAAGSATGAITMTAPADNKDAVITLGAGDDVFTTDDDGFATADLFAVEAGAGNDILVLGAAADLDTAAEGARYTGFDVLRTGDSQDMDFASVSALQITGAASKSYTDMTATQAANVQVRGDETSATFALKTATGTEDTLSLTMGTGLTTSAATDIVTGVTVTGFETLNIIENGGATAAVGAAQTAIIAAFTGSTLDDINLSGRAVTLSNVATTVAVNIDGTQLTGNGATTGAQGLTVAGSAVVGSIINGSEVRDSLTAGAEGSTYNGNGGNDAFSATVALIAADGTTDLVLNGGAGTDTLTLTNTTGNTIADTHFTNISAMEALALTATGGDVVLTTGAAFNAAFASGVTITTGTLQATSDVDVNAGLSTVAMTITVDATSLTGAATETNNIETGSGADTVTFTGDADYVGVAAEAAQGTIVIDTNAGNDTISVTVGTLDSASATGGQAITIIGGTGADSITKVGVNDTVVLGTAHFQFAAGDSSTTAWDTITGFDAATGTLLSDVLDFEGSAAVSAFTATEDFGVIKSHSVSNGLVSFDDVADYSAALVINSSNVADVVGYLSANVAANGTVALRYDNNSDGTAESTMVFHQGSAASVADDLVLLSNVALDGISATATLTTADFGVIA